MVKIKLLVDLPIESFHGMMQNQVYDVLMDGTPGRGNVRWYVLSSESGIIVGVFAHEAEAILDDSNESPLT